MIESTAIFTGLSDDTMDLVRHRITTKHLNRGELLFSMGDPSEAMYIVKTGRIRIWTVSAAGSEITLDVLGAETVFGEIGLLDGSERTASASALDRAELLSVPRAAFESALDSDPQLVRNVIKFLCDRLRWVIARLEDSALRTAPERLARIIAHLCTDYGVETPEGLKLSINLTQAELARWTQMSRENLNKILSRWTVEGLLTQDRSQITVHNSDRIEEIAEFGEE